MKIKIHDVIKINVEDKEIKLLDYRITTIAYKQNITGLTGRSQDLKKGSWRVVSGSEALTKAFRTLAFYEGYRINTVLK